MDQCSSRVTRVQLERFLGEILNLKALKYKMAEEFKHIVRIANTDLKGERRLRIAMTQIKGISFMFSNLLCVISGLDANKKVGDLSQPEIDKIEKILEDPIKAGAPVWMLNRRKDYENGEPKHILASDLKFIQDNDIKRMRKIKCYRGVRHSSGLPSRGQRTKSNFRRNKGKVSLGVKKKAAAKSGK